MGNSILENLQKNGNSPFIVKLAKIVKPDSKNYFIAMPIFQTNQQRLRVFRKPVSKIITIKEIDNARTV